MKNKIKIFFLGYDYFGGQFLQTILENHSDKFEVVGISTNIIAQPFSFRKKLKKLKILFKKKIVLWEFKEKVLFKKLINFEGLKNNPPVYPDIKVKTLAEGYNIPVIDSSVVYAGDVEKINAFGADYIIIASFGKIPAAIYSNNPGSIINFHPSFLPELRGGSPVYTAIMKQQKITGFSYHHLSDKFDAGPLLYQERIPIREDQNCRDLEIEIAKTGAAKLYDLLNEMQRNTITPIDITNRPVSRCFRTYEISALLRPSTTTTIKLLDQIRACHSWAIGSAYLRVGIKHFYITDAAAVIFDRSSLKAKIDYINGYGLLMKTLDGIVRINSVYYKKQYFADDELLKLKGLLF
jgi:methionyl-tRNA formyltransferase